MLHVPPENNEFEGEIIPCSDFLLDFVDEEATDDAWDVSSYLSGAYTLLASLSRGLSRNEEAAENIILFRCCVSSSRRVLGSVQSSIWIRAMFNFPRKRLTPLYAWKSTRKSTWKREKTTTSLPSSMFNKLISTSKLLRSARTLPPFTGLHQSHDQEPLTIRSPIRQFGLFSR
ncbi:hypothetical protein Tco_0855602 [Tanacetum coccineum]